MQYINGAIKTVSLMLVLAQAPAGHANSPVFAPIDAYIKTKVFDSGADLIPKMSKLETEFQPVLDRYKENDHYYRASLAAAEAESLTVADPDPYRHQAWRESMQREIKSFCCEIRVTPRYRSILMKWLDEWMNTEDAHGP